MFSKSKSACLEHVGLDAGDESYDGLLALTAPESVTSDDTS